MKDRGRVEAQLINAGLGPVLQQLLDGPLAETISLPLSSLKTAKRIQRLLYSWLGFWPDIKAEMKIRLVEETATLLLIPTAGAEKRGRRRLV